MMSFIAFSFFYPVADLIQYVVISCLFGLLFSRMAPSLSLFLMTSIFLKNIGQQLAIMFLV